MKRRVEIILICAAGAILFLGVVGALYLKWGAESQPPMPDPEPSNQTVGESAELISFDWYQNHMSMDGCFSFSLTQKNGKEKLSAWYWDDEGRRELTDVPVSAKHWKKLEDYLRTHTFPDYHPPAADVLDATDSLMTMVWRDGEEEKTIRYNGEMAAELRTLLTEIATETQEAIQVGK